MPGIMAAALVVTESPGIAMLDMIVMKMNNDTSSCFVSSHYYSS
jgi:hypothetical protein